MGDSSYRSGRISGYQSEVRNDSTEEIFVTGKENQKGKEDDLIIEDNTVYEIDRECYERMKKQKKR